MKAEFGIETSYLRLKAYPFTPELMEFIRRHKRAYVVEQNRDAQLLGLMRLDFDAADIAKIEKHAILRRSAARRANRHR